MDLQYDESGFLTGDSIDLGSGKSALLAIQADVRAIRNIVSGRVRKADNPNPGSTSLPRGRDVAEPVVRVTVSSDAISAGQRPSVGATGLVMTALRNAPTNAKMEPISSHSAVPLRGDDGRFLGGGNGDGGNTSENHRLSDAARWLRDAISGTALNGAEGADPMIKSYQEVATPVKSVLGMAGSLAGIGGNKKDKFLARWYRKIFGELTLFRKSDEKASKKTNKLLTDIEDKPSGRNGESGIGGSLGGGMLGGILALIKRIPIIGTLLVGLGSIVAKFGGGLAKLIKRIPIVGTLFAGALAVFDIFESENDPNLSRREKDQRAGGAVGGVAGMLSGALAGAAAGSLLGPIGTVVGSIIGGFLGDQAGKILGDTVGGWVNDLRGSDIPGKITEALGAVTDYIMSGWDTATDAWHRLVDGASSRWESITSTISAITDGIDSFLSGIFGFGLPDGKDFDKAVESGVDYLSGSTVGRWLSGLVGTESPARSALPAVMPVSSPAIEVSRPVMMRQPLPRPVPINPIPEHKTRLTELPPQKVNVSIQSPDAGQDVRDRNIAHIASGGIAG